MARTTLTRSRRSHATRSPGSRRSTRSGANRASRIRRASTTRSRRSRQANRASRATRTSRSPAVGVAAIQRFLDGLSSDLTSGNGHGAAARFEYPALMVMSSVGDYGGSQVLQDEPTVAEFFDRAPEQYRAKGIEQTTAIIEGIEWVSDDLCLVRVNFPYLDEGGFDMGDGETSLYLLRKAGDEYAICCAITLGAESDLAQARSR